VSFYTPPLFSKVGAELISGYGSAPPYTDAGGLLEEGYTAPAFTDAGGFLIGYIPPDFTDVGGDLYVPPDGGQMAAVLTDIFVPSIYALSAGELQIDINIDLTSSINTEFEASNPILMSVPVPLVVTMDSLFIPYDQMTVQVPLTFTIDMDTNFTPVPQLNGVLRIRF
jgi:hypothetical protein